MRSSSDHPAAVITRRRTNKHENRLKEKQDTHANKANKHVMNNKQTVEKRRQNAEIKSNP